MDLREGMETMSLDGRSGGVLLRGLDGEGLRTVIYVNIFPNVLVSLHPDYVMTHRLTPLAADRPASSAPGRSLPRSLDGPSFDPSYAHRTSGTSPTSRTGVPARRCSAVCPRPTPGPGPLSAGEEDAVYQFVTMVARGYLGQAGAQHRLAAADRLSRPARTPRSATSRRTWRGPPLDHLVRR